MFEEPGGQAIFAPMHPKNRYQGDHDFAGLSRVVPELSKHLITTPDDRTSLDFTHPDAVRHLNRALLLRDYDLKFWDIPKGSLCPGVPGRLDYIHVLNDLPSIKGRKRTSGDGKKGKPKIQVLDIGTGASLIYPILGAKEYGWNFVGTDVAEASLKVAKAIADFNPSLRGKVELRKQPSRDKIFQGVVLPFDYFDYTLCNPPFFADEQGARRVAETKWVKLGEDLETGHNFGGTANELWTPGGEPAFLRRMILESIEYQDQVGWFTTLVSKKGYLRNAKQLLDQANTRERKIIQISQGGKIRRILAWRF